jgi:hypothetical protein
VSAQILQYGLARSVPAADLSRHRRGAEPDEDGDPHPPGRRPGSKAQGDRNLTSTTLAAKTDA